MGSGMKAGNDPITKRARQIDPRSKASVEEMRGSGKSKYHQRLQNEGNLDGKMREGRSEAGQGQSAIHNQLKSDRSNMDGTKQRSGSK